MEEDITTENEPESALAESSEEAQPQSEKPAAFTLVIQSWATPIVGIIMLIIGLFGGYYGHALLSTKNDATAAEEVSSVEQAPTTNPTPDATRVAQQKALMAAVVDRTRHFLGNPDAPVTIIEFSDFQ